MPALCGHSIAVITSSASWQRYVGDWRLCVHFHGTDPRRRMHQSLNVTNASYAEGPRMLVALIIADVALMATAIWNIQASLRAGRAADWRTDRTGLRPPGSSFGLSLLSMVLPAGCMVVVAFGASLPAALTGILAYSIAFAALSVQERRRAETYYRGLHQ